MQKVFVLLAFTPALCFAQNAFQNSSMDNASGWSGDRKFVTVDDNRVISLEAKKNKTLRFYQGADTSDTKDVVLKFRYQTTDYQGRGLQLRGKRPDGSSTFRNIELKTDGQWNEYAWDFSEVNGSRRMEFSLELLEGSGTVLIDDVMLVPNE